MEGYTKTLSERLKRTNEQYLKGDKYTEYFQNDDRFFKRVDNVLDDFVRVSFWLANFLISTPPKFQSPKERQDEELDDYDEPKITERPELLFEDSHFSIKDLDLPPDIESEFDLNYFLFYAFVSFIKPSYYYIHEYDIVRYTDKESLKHNVTRVLANLVQLMIFVRSFEEDDSGNDLKVNAVSLLLNFSKFFTLKSDDLPENVQSSLKQLYPREAALFTMFLLIYDKGVLNDSYENYKDLFSLTLESQISENSASDYTMELERYRNLLISAFESSAGTEEFLEKARQQIPLKEVESSLFKLSITLTGKTLKVIKQLDQWSLEVSYQSKNDSQILAETELRFNTQISELESQMEQRLLDKHQTEIKNLREQLEQANDENRLVKENLRITTDLASKYKDDLERALESTNGSSNKPFQYQDLEKNYPQLINSIQKNAARWALTTTFAKIEETDKENKDLKEKLENSRPKSREAENVDIEDDNVKDEEFNIHDQPQYADHNSRSLIKSGGSTPHGYGSSHLQGPPQPLPSQQIPQTYNSIRAYYEPHVRPYQQGPSLPQATEYSKHPPNMYDGRYDHRQGYYHR